MNDLNADMKEQIHANSLANVKNNLKILAKDERFTNHTKDEILLVAYFRGYHECISLLKNQVPLYEIYDENMADRTIIKNQLPQMVEELNDSDEIKQKWFD